MAFYKCLRSCALASFKGYFQKGGVYEFGSDPGANFEAFSGDVFTSARPPSLRDLERTYYFGSVGWDDLRFPFSGLNPPGQVSDPDFDTDDGLPLFDAASTEVVSGLAQMPHAWREGSTIYPHVHWEPTDGNSGNVLWRMEHKIAAPNGVFPESWTAVDVVDAAAEAVRTHQIAPFGGLDMTGKGLSTLIKFKVSRIGGDASDTYGADAKGLEFDIHYLIDSIGSGKEFIK